VPHKENEGDQQGPFRRCYPGYCSFCRKHYRDVGPLVEGPDLVFICCKCIDVCRTIIEDECLRLGRASPWADDAAGEKGPNEDRDRV
jgi:ATP-dependent Clp protease ATP-binding subunit ClpX